MNAKILENIKKLNPHQWNIIFYDILFEKNNTKWTLPLGDGPMSILMNIYRLINLHNKKLLTNYFNACFYNLKTIPKIQSNAKELYCLIYIIHETKPIEYKDYIISLIISNEFGRLQYGNSELESLLVKTCILLEDKNNSALKEWFGCKKTHGYYFYLKPLFYSHIQDYEQTLSLLNEVLIGDIKLTYKESIIFHNTLIDIFPERIQFTELIKFLHKNKTRISNNENLNKTLNKTITTWRNEKSYPIQLVLHLEDYFNQNQNNLSQTMLDYLTNLDIDLSFILTEYYDDQKYNLPEKNYETMEELIENLFAECTY